MMTIKVFRIALTTLLLAAPLSLFASEPVSVLRGTVIRHPRQPQAAVGEDGAIYVAFGADESIYISKSTDRGRTFGESVQVGAIPGLALGMRRGPRVVAGSGFVVVSAIGHKDGNLLAWRSTNGGASWSGPVRVNDSPGDAGEGLHAMAMSPAGQVTCVWLDHRHGTTQIYGASSTDGGRNWGENTKVYASPTGNVCECCHPAAAYAHNGDLYVMWRNSLAGNRDMYFAASRDGGKTYSAGEKLGRGSWKLDACPMDGGYLAVPAAGTVTTIWRRENKVFRADSNGQAEELLGTGLQPWAAAAADGAYLVWISHRPGDLWLLAPGADQPRKLAENGNDPMVAAPISGDGPVVVVWEAGQPDAPLCAMIVDE